MIWGAESGLPLHCNSPSCSQAARKSAGPQEDLKTESWPHRIMRIGSCFSSLCIILSCHDSVFLLSFWLRLCRAVLIASLWLHSMCPSHIEKTGSAAPATKLLRRGFWAGRQTSEIWHGGERACFRAAIQTRSGPSWPGPGSPAAWDLGGACRAACRCSWPLRRFPSA